MLLQPIAMAFYLQACRPGPRPLLPHPTPLPLPLPRRPAGAMKTAPRASDKDHVNRLAKEKSPYLLQHQHNPVGGGGGDGGASGDGGG